MTWNGTAVATGGTALAALEDEAGNNANLDCADDTDGTNATFGVTLDTADFNAAAPGEYQDTLTLTISPS